MYMKMKRIIICIIILLFLSIYCGYSGDNIDELLQSASVEKRNTKEGLKELISEAEKELKAKPNDYELNWQYAALVYFYGEYFVNAKKEKKSFYTKCKDYAYKATKINPDGVAGHYWLGVGYAKWSEANGVLSSLFYADDVLNEMTETIKRNPAFFKGVPWAIRATVYAFAPQVISVGDPQKARTDLLYAMAYGEGYRITYQIVAKVYIQLAEWEEASKVIEMALALPFNSLQEVEERVCISELWEYKKKVDKELSNNKK